MTPLLLNEKEAAIVLNISLSKLQKSRSKASDLIARRKVPPYVKIDGSIRYVKSDLDNFQVQPCYVLDNRKKKSQPHKTEIRTVDVSKNENTSDDEMVPDYLADLMCL